MPQAFDAARPSADTLLTEAQVADLLSLKPATLQAYRARGTAPRHYRLPALRYRYADVMEWMSDRLVNPANKKARA